ncbi:MAG: aldehyde dehydrogenase [Pseudomonadales bacterium]
MEHFQQYINGEFSSGSARFDSRDPSSGELWATMPESRSDDVNNAVNAAHSALRSGEWATMTATQRGKLLYKLADLVTENAGSLAEIETRDTGKIIRETAAQTAYVADYYRYYAGMADKIQGAHLPIDKPDVEVWLRREPIGVVAAIVPWNNQLFLAAVKLGPALAAGCTVVLKASEEGAAPSLALAKLFHEAGFPPGVVNVITGFPAECSEVLTRHPKVSHIAFTGGPITARKVVENSAASLAGTSLELGGKSPFIVFDDADLESAANAQVTAVFAAAGQSCVSGSRLLVQSGIKDAFVSRMKEKAEAIHIGDPLLIETEVGPLCTRRQRDNIQAIVQESLDAGATLVTGGRAPDKAGNYYLPTIIDCATGDVACVRKELFGPVLSVQTFDSEEEAITMANDTEFGLASGVFTRDLARAHRMIAAIHAGIVWVNTYRAVSPIVPFGGFGESGQGREGGMAAVLDYTKTKSVWVRTSDETLPDPFVMR